MTDIMREKPYWWPQRVDAEWRKRIRADYPDETKELDDDALDDKYAEGWKYADTWDHLGDARHDYEQLADAFFEVIAAQADARALVGELVSNWFALNNHEGVEVSAAGDDAAKAWNGMCQSIDKAQAFMEGK